MPDFTYHPHEMCAQLEHYTAEIPSSKGTGTYTVTLGGERDWPTCTCKAYKYPKYVENFGGRMVPARCKHITEAEGMRCSWHAAYSDQEQQTPGVCPKCGGPTVTVLVAA